MLLDNWIETIGFLACGLVFLTFCMKTLTPLRLLAIASNIAFIAYAIFADLMPILLLHAALLPLNLWRGVQLLHLFRPSERPAHRATEIDALLPIMCKLTCAAGTTLFARGEHAENIYYVESGRVHIPEVDKSLEKGDLFGEIGPFAPDRKRTASATCETDCTLRVIRTDALEKHCLKEPAFGVFLAKRIAARVAENLQWRMPVAVAALPESTSHHKRSNGTATTGMPQGAFSTAGE